MRSILILSSEPTSSRDLPVVSSTTNRTKIAPKMQEMAKMSITPCKSNTSNRIGNSLTQMNVTTFIEKQIIAMPYVLI